MSNRIPILPDALVRDDLFKPIFGAAFMGLFMSSLEGISKRNRLIFYGIIVGIGIVWLTHYRAMQEED